MLVFLHWFEKPDIANVVGFVDYDLTYSFASETNKSAENSLQIIERWCE